MEQSCSVIFERLTRTLAHSLTHRCTKWNACSPLARSLACLFAQRQSSILFPFTKNVWLTCSRRMSMSTGWNGMAPSSVHTTYGQRRLMVCNGNWWDGRRRGRWNTRALWTGPCPGDSRPFCEHSAYCCCSSSPVGVVAVMVRHGRRRRSRGSRLMIVNQVRWFMMIVKQASSSSKNVETCARAHTGVWCVCALSFFVFCFLFFRNLFSHWKPRLVVCVNTWKAHFILGWKLRPNWQID